MKVKYRKIFKNKNRLLKMPPKISSLYDKALEKIQEHRERLDQLQMMNLQDSISRKMPFQEVNYILQQQNLKKQKAGSTILHHLKKYIASSSDLYRFVVRELHVYMKEQGNDFSQKLPSLVPPNYNILIPGEYMDYVQRHPYTKKMNVLVWRDFIFIIFVYNKKLYSVIFADLDLKATLSEKLVLMMEEKMDSWHVDLVKEL